jgi:hypothetical protein
MIFARLQACGERSCRSNVLARIEQITAILTPASKNSIDLLYNRSECPSSGLPIQIQTGRLKCVKCFI